MGPEMMRSSQLEKRQEMRSTAKDEIRGPRVGEKDATAAQSATAYGNSDGLQISANDAPTVARQGEAMKPIRNRRTMRPGKLLTSEAGMQSMTNRKPEIT